MSADQTLQKNKEVVRVLYEDCLNKGKLELLNDCIADDYEDVRGVKGLLGFAETIKALRQGFPDIKFTIDDLIAEADRVAVNWTWHGSHMGIFINFQPTQKQISNNGIAIYQLKNNKITCAWIQTDRLGFLQHIGVIPVNLSLLPWVQGNNK